MCNPLLRQNWPVRVGCCLEGGFGCSRARRGLGGLESARLLARAGGFAGDDGCKGRRSLFEHLGL